MTLTHLRAARSRQAEQRALGGCGTPIRPLLLATLVTLALGQSLSAQAAPTSRTVQRTVAPAAAPSTSFTTDLGYVSATGNTRVSTVNIAERIVHSRGLWRFEQTFGVIYGEADGEENANLLRAGLGVQYAFLPLVSLATGVRYDRNRFAGAHVWRSSVFPGNARSRSQPGSD